MEVKTTTINRKRLVIYDTYANFPVSGLESGDLAYATDRKVLYRWSGSAWQFITIHSSSGGLAARPAIATMPNGSLYFATEVKKLYQAQAGAWAELTAESYEPKSSFRDSPGGYELPGWFYYGSTQPQVSMASKHAYFVPIYVATARPYQGIAFHVLTTSTPGRPRVGLYSMNENGSVGSLIEDCGTVAISTTGTKVALFATTRSLKGYYYLAVVGDSYSSLPKFAGFSSDPTQGWIIPPILNSVHNTSYAYPDDMSRIIPSYTSDNNWAVNGLPDTILPETFASIQYGGILCLKSPD